MLTLPTSQEEILGYYSLHSCRFYDLRLNAIAGKGIWEMRCQAWIDHMEIRPSDKYEGPSIWDGEKNYRPLYVPAKIIFKDVHDIRYFTSIKNSRPVDFSTLDLELKDEIIEKFKKVNLPIPKSLILDTGLEQELTYDQFIYAVDTCEGIIEEAHNCDSGIFHVTFDHIDDLQMKIGYSEASVHLGAEAIHG